MAQEVVVEEGGNELHHLDEDLLVDMKNLEDRAVDDYEKAKKFAKDVEDVYDGWMTILSTTSYLVSEYPTIIEALHQSDRMGSDLLHSVESGNV